MAVRGTLAFVLLSVFISSALFIKLATAAKNPGMAKCRKAAKAMPGKVYYRAALPINTTFLFHTVDDPLKNPYIKSKIAEYDIQGLRIGDWNNENPPKRKSSAEIEVLGFRAKIVVNEKKRPVSSEGNCYYTVRDARIESVGKKKIPLVDKLKIKIHAMALNITKNSHPYKPNTMAKVSARIIWAKGVSDMQKRVIDGAVETKLGEWMGKIKKMVRKFIGILNTQKARQDAAAKEDESSVEKASAEEPQKPDKEEKPEQPEQSAPQGDGPTGAAAEEPQENEPALEAEEEAEDGSE